ncbi:response regulator (plasmid) [Niallia taxi]|uniref:DNA-binding response regulator n=1 Tax=Niallia circulans TaxID=1397 RepID=A0A553SQK6_NIACI|nr:MULTISPECIES: response regulator transcription factor [Niallia]MED4057134.1 response regulator transcription factor [Niallia taxi]MED4122178.1 response regulator transcription factor [Niallia taxi]TRZ39268.1 DNA-binding response regulator [Niallia circulans]
MDKIQLMLVEDDPVWMKGIANYIEAEEDLTVNKKAYSKEEALNIDCSNIDVALLDISLSKKEDFSGLEVVKHLKEKGIDKVIMLTSWEDPAVILKAFDNGAINFISKSSYKEIPNVIREAHLNKVNIRPDIFNVIMNELKLERKTRVLTPIESEVYRLKIKGFTRSQIAQKLVKSTETIKKQLQIIKKKLNDSVS